MSDSDEIEVFVSAGKLTGWKSIEVVRTIESVAHGFALTMSELERDDPNRRILKRGDRVEVRIAGEPMVKGYVRKLAPSYGKGNHEVSVTGWDATADLIKCSNMVPLHTPAKLETIAAQICKPFGIAVSTDVDTGAEFETFKAEVGATADSLIDHLVRYRGVIRISDGLGGLLITLPGSEASTITLRLGDNILAARAVFDDTERFQLITHEVQRETAWGGAAAGAPLRATVTDPNMDASRYLPLLELPKDPPDGSTALEALIRRDINLRAARSQRISYTVKGWRHDSEEGPLWTPGELVKISDPWLAVDQDLLLTTATFAFQKNKRTSKLQFMRPEAFDLRAMKEPKAGDNVELWDTKDSSLASLQEKLADAPVDSRLGSLYERFTKPE